MSHYRLLTELPPRPLRPEPPTLRLDEVWERCRDELPDVYRSALWALMELDEPPTEPGEAGVTEARQRMARAQALAEAARSPLLCAWVEHEQVLREALAATRAAAKEMTWPAPTIDVAEAAAALAPTIAAVMSHDDPGARQRAVDAVRLRALDELVHDELSTEALSARVLAAVVVERWVETTPTDPDTQGNPLEEDWT